MRLLAISTLLAVAASATASDFEEMGRAVLRGAADQEAMGRAIARGAAAATPPSADLSLGASVRASPSGRDVLAAQAPFRLLPSPGGELPATTGRWARPPSYMRGLQEVFLKYGKEGSVPAADINRLSKTHGRKVVEVCYDLRQMARDAGVVIPEPKPEPKPPVKVVDTRPVDIPAGELGARPRITGDYLYALERVLEKYELVRLVPANSLAYLGRKFGRDPAEVRADLGEIAKPAHDVMPDYAY